MTSNPLARRQAEDLTSGPERIRKHVDMLNRFNWVKASGKLYFVATKTRDDGSVEYRVERHT